jgi:hypothetical protein
MATEYTKSKKKMKMKDRTYSFKLSGMQLLPQQWKLVVMFNTLGKHKSLLKNLPFHEKSWLKHLYDKYGC